MEQYIEAVKKVADGTKEEISNTILIQCEKMLESKLSYLAIMSDDEKVLTMIGWSNSAMENCKLITQPIVYQLTDTGLWGDCVRERKPVITNDYAGCTKPTKKGYPEGHVQVTNHMNVPIFEDDMIVALVGVGNRDKDYTDQDAKTLMTYLDEVWPILEDSI